MDAAQWSRTARLVAAVGIVTAWAGTTGSCAVPGISLGDTPAADSSGSGSGDGDGEDDGGGTGRKLLDCDIENVGDPDDCSGDCNAVIEGAEGVFQCTVTCDATEQDCGEGYYCQIFADGGTACLEDCSNGAGCTSSKDACDEVLSVCLPKDETGGGDDDDDGSDAKEVSTVCKFAVVENTDDCDEDCDQPVYTGDGLYVCTTSCDVELNDCPGAKYRCETVDDGTGGCFLDCADGNACPGDDYACDAYLELCIPTRD